ncbi:MAG: thiamine pyrophosphate-binding protein [Proteobacteria bacterium]|nr:thiamine pyrophosphate-binding protein [Pseudomonadota bacterium]
MTPARAKRSMRATMPLGDFLVAYLNRAGVDHIFGLPGDLVLGLFQRFGRDRGLEIVTFSHEPAVGFAADGYARSTRRLGVVCVTYGAGGHNVVNPIAGAYAEQVPLLVVSGGPGEAEQKVALVHHQVKDVEGQCRIFSEVTCIAQLVARPELAAEQIHEVVGTILSEMRPGYLEIHRDMVDVPIPVPAHLRSWDGHFPRPTSDPRKLEEAVAETAARLRAAVRPVLIGGVELFRDRAEGDFQKLAEKLGVPVLSTVLAKGVFPMDHPLHLGIYIGPASHPAILDRVRRADLVLDLGDQRTDLNLGASASQIPPERCVWAVSGRVEISHHQYRDVELAEFVASLSRAKLPRFREKVVYRDNLKRGATRSGVERALSVNDLLVEVNDFLADHGDYHAVAESGDMLFGGLELRLHGAGLYLAQGYYASMGFAVPAAMGAQIGTGLRPLVLCGDGGFQMTGPEIAHAPKLGLSPIVVLVNNGGWGIFRPVTAQADLLEIPNWPYAELAQAWGGVGFQASRRTELRDALRAAHEVKGFVLIECTVPPNDLSPLGRRYIKGSARRGRARSRS